jgi:hypothetical protein
MSLPHRDSVIWTAGMIGGACVALASHFTEFPWIPPHGAALAIELIAFLYSVCSAPRWRPVTRRSRRSELSRRGRSTVFACVSLETAGYLKGRGWLVVGPDPHDTLALQEFERAQRWKQVWGRD